MPQNEVYYSPESCSWCSGTGIDRRSIILRKCSVCKGNGSVLVAQPPRVCGWCNGTGKDKYSLLWERKCTTVEDQVGRMP